MSKCRYIPTAQLPAHASDEHIDAILDAIATGQIRVVGKAARVVEGVWGMRIPQFIGAIEAHLHAGFRLFRKHVSNPPPETIFFSANIGLDPDSDDEDDDVYVEIRLTGRVVVIVCDAHNHWNWQPRLPK